MKYKEIIDKLTIKQKCDLLTGRDFWSTLEIKDLDIPSAFLSDGPHGLRKQAAASDHLGLNASIPATCFPTAATIANSFNLELGERIGQALAMEAISMDVNMILGPGTNIKRNPLCGRNFEYFSEDPYLSGKMAASYVSGIQSKGIYACVKHFAGNNQELRRMTVNSEIDERALREIYLMPFELAVKDGHAKGIMSSYNRINGEYANESIYLLKKILRDEWGFNGVVVSDWGGCNDRVLGVIAGSDLEMPSCKYGSNDIYKALTDGWENPYSKADNEKYMEIQRCIINGKLDIKLVDECCDRILNFIFETNKNIKKNKVVFDKNLHHNLAYQAAVESIVLLKNNDALPLGKEKVCFIGDFCKNPRYQGAGSSVVNPLRLDSVYDEVKNYGINFVGFERGFNRYGKNNKRLFKRAISLAEKSDKIIFFMGLDEVSEAEGLDRTSINIPLNQLRLLKALQKLNKKVVVVISAGSSTNMEVINDSDAILHSYLSGEAGARAILDILTGKENPSGKLSESFAKKYEDNSSSNYFPARLSTRYKESIYVGYRYYDTKNIDVTYPFGYGLSYTTFKYSNLIIDSSKVTFDITNTGKYKGKEVAELYIGKKDSKVFRANKELKGFIKIELMPGETKTVSIAFDEYSFRVFNPKKNQFEIENGKYEIYIGSSSRDILLTGNVNIDGVELDFGYSKEIEEKYKNCDITDVSDELFEKLIGRKLITDEYSFYKKKRMIIYENATVEDLRYSRSFVGRAFSRIIRHLIKFLRAVGAKTTANTLVMGVLHQPIRGIAKFGGLSRNKLEGLLLIFNGHFFKGMHRFLKRERRKR